MYHFFLLHSLIEKKAARTSLSATLLLRKALHIIFPKLSYIYAI